MQMQPCRFCGEKCRLGVRVKQMRSNDGFYPAAYGHCKKCHARGSLISGYKHIAFRDVQTHAERKQIMIDLAVAAWNGTPESITDLPLFERN